MNRRSLGVASLSDVNLIRSESAVVLSAMLRLKSVQYASVNIKLLAP